MMNLFAELDIEDTAQSKALSSFLNAFRGL